MLEKVIKLLKEPAKEWRFLSSDQRPILFDHIPKCAGSTVGRFLSSSVPKRLSYHLKGGRSHKQIEKFRKWPAQKRNKVMLISGHHASQLINYAHPNTVNAVVLREPVDRIISHYYFVKRTKGHYLHEKVTEGNISLADYCHLDLSRELQNWYIVHFTGLSLSEIEKNPEESVELALNNVRNTFDVIGFQDDLPGFIQELSETANIKNNYQDSFVNRSSKRANKEEIDETTLARIAEKNALDITFFSQLMSLEKNQKAGVL